MTPTQWLAELLASERLTEMQLYAYARAMAAYLSDEDIIDIFVGEMPDNIAYQTTYLTFDDDDEDREVDY